MDKQAKKGGNNKQDPPNDDQDGDRVDNGNGDQK